MMPDARGARAPAAGYELVFAMALGWAVLAAIPILQGGIGISWDALNHQVYLGWTAAASRFHLDVMPAGSQTYQYPYLYWPLYELASRGLSGTQAGVVLASIQVLHVPALWLVARSCIPDAGWFGAAMRLLALVGAFLSGLVLSLFDTTSNDMLAAIPLVWAFAIAFVHATGDGSPRAGRAAVCGSALLGGISVAFKFSNGPLAILLPLLWALAPGSHRQRIANVALGCAIIVVSAVVAYAPWGWKLWAWFGNPVYPLADAWFAPLRAATGWQP